MTTSQINSAPSSSDIHLTLVEDTRYVFKLSDFPFSDTDVGQSIKFVKFNVTPTRGELYLRGVKVQVNQEIAAEDIASGLLSYVPMRDASGQDYTSFVFSVSDGVSYSLQYFGGYEILPMEDAPRLQASTGYRIEAITDSSIRVGNSFRLTDGNVALVTTKHFYEGGDFWCFVVSLNRMQSTQVSNSLPSIELAHKFQNSTVSSVIPLQNGGFLVAGTYVQDAGSASQLSLTKFDRNGNLDKEFNLSGILNVPLAHSVLEAQVLVQTDGKYLVSTKGNSSPSDQYMTFTLDRYNADGSIDASFQRFGVSSYLEIKPGQFNSTAVQADGKILQICKDGRTDDFVLIRLNGDGGIDQGFGHGGFIRLFNDQFGQTPITTLIDNDGRILILSKGQDAEGQATVDVLRLNSDGSLDQSFSEDGHLGLSLAKMNLHLEKIVNLVLSIDGKILITGTAIDQAEPIAAYSDRVFILRLNQNGDIDKTFDSDGVVQLSIEEDGEMPLNLFVEPDGKLLLSASSYLTNDYTLFARWNSDGSVDQSFARPAVSMQSASNTYSAILDPNIWIADPEMPFRSDGRAELIIRRSGEANTEDIFHFPEKFNVGSGSYTSYDGKIYRNEVAIANFSNHEGSLKLKFEGLNQYSDVVSILQNVRYSNIQSGSERIVTLDWIFDEAIDGQQSIGVAQTEVIVPASNNSIPTASNLRGDLNPFSNYVFSLAEFQFRDRDPTDSFQGITILSLPEHKGLFLNNIEVVKNQFISKADIANGFLRFRSMDLSDGHFTFSVSDGKSNSIPYDWTANVSETIITSPEIFAISGNYTQGQTLTAILKANDLGDSNSVRYQWTIDGFADSQLTGSSLTPNSFMVGKQINVTIHYQDIFGNMKIYRAIGSTPIQVGNDAPTGTPIITGQYVVGERLTFSGGISDGDGIETNDGQSNFLYQWKANGVDIIGATSPSLLLIPELSGKNITLQLQYVDLKGKLETVVGGKPFNVNEVNKFSTNDKVKIANTGDNIFLGSVADDTVVINYSLKNYVLSRSNEEYRLMGRDSVDGYHIFRDIEHLRFQDFSVNLEVTSKARAMLLNDVNRLIELYISFFNRIPDSDGLSYWIDEFNNGKSINQIAKSFYDAGVQYSELTGFSKTMSEEDFINVIYRNTLGRTNGADAEGLKYWSEQLKQGKATYGSLVSDILNSAHGFKGDATWGWVADLLDNKIFVASKIAVDWGISFNSPEESIKKGMDIVAAVTPTNSWDAIKLIGLGTDGIYL